jgi:hypothetical protein
VGFGSWRFDSSRPHRKPTVRSDGLEEPGDLDPPLFVAVCGTA